MLTVSKPDYRFLLRGILFSCAILLTFNHALAQEEITDYESDAPIATTEPIDEQLQSDFTDPDSEPTATIEDIHTDLHLMTYIAGEELLDPDFDCDDFAWATDEVLEDMGFSCWQYAIAYDTDCDGTGDEHHLLNIVEVAHDGSDLLAKFCAYESMQDKVIGCWLQEKTKEITPPQWILDKIAEYYADLAPHLDGCDVLSLKIWDDSHASDGHTSDEPPFIEDPELCELYEELTGYCIPYDYNTE